jgi:hypothetical protein
MPTTTITAVEPDASPRPAPAEAAADEAAVTTLLNCYLRETGTEATGTVRLERLGLELAVPVAYRSATGQHAYRLPATLARPGGAPVPLDHVTLATLLGKELAFEEGDRARLGGFVTAVASSAANVATFLAADRPGAGATPFLRAEQSLAAGHPLHPAAKSRQPMTPEEVRRYAPELGAAFPLRWFRADRSVVASDSALATGRPSSWPASAPRGGPGRPPRRCGPSTGPTRPSCSSCRWGCASPTRSGSTWPRSWPAGSRSTGCWPPGSGPSWPAASPSSRWSATRPG